MRPGDPLPLCFLRRSFSNLRLRNVGGSGFGNQEWAFSPFPNARACLLPRPAVGSSGRSQKGRRGENAEMRPNHIVGKFYTCSLKRFLRSHGWIEFANQFNRLSCVVRIWCSSCSSADDRQVSSGRLAFARGLLLQATNSINLGMNMSRKALTTFLGMLAAIMIWGPPAQAKTIGSSFDPTYFSGSGTFFVPDAPSDCLTLGIGLHFVNYPP